VKTFFLFLAPREASLSDGANLNIFSILGADFRHQLYHVFLSHPISQPAFFSSQVVAF